SFYRTQKMAALASTVLISLFLPSIAEFVGNELVETPEIICNTDTIEMNFRTRQPFSGKVYVKGHYNRPECRVDYAERGPDGRPKGGIRLNHGACDMDRQRMVTDEGMMFSTVLVISFHPLFITKVDRAFNIKCMYREATRAVEQELDVSALPTETLSNEMPMPTCSYTIRRDQLDGPILRYARVGDQVVHRWECESEMYGVLVHSCFVEDGQGEKAMIVDERGCHTDHTLLGDPTYVEALNMAYRESFVFKFADRVAVRFQCEIRLCIKEDNGCDGITPPICFDSSRNRINTTRLLRRRRSSSHIREGDLISQTLYVIEKEEQERENESPDVLRSISFESVQNICLTPREVFSLVSLLGLLIMFTLLLALFVCCRRFYMVSDEQRHFMKS
ncbi:hypothetical protein PENTCL1PPCAC_27727, partial [Pristionchus entomophagus]